MDSLPPSWVFVGNKPLITNVTLVIANQDDVGELWVRVSE